MFKYDKHSSHLITVIQREPRVLIPSYSESQTKFFWLKDKVIHVPITGKVCNKTQKRKMKLLEYCIALQ